MTSTTSSGQCKATTKDGAPCRAAPLAGEEWCYFHHPDRAAERARGRSKGGHARHGRKLERVVDVGEVRLESVADVLHVLEAAMRSLFTMEPSISRSRAVAYVSKTALSALELGALEERMAGLEARLERLEHLGELEAYGEQV